MQIPAILKTETYFFAFSHWERVARLRRVRAARSTILQIDEILGPSPKGRRSRLLRFPPRQFSEHEFQRQLHDSRVLRGKDLAEILIVQCRDRYSSAITIGQIERFAARFDTHAFANPEDSRYSHIDFPEARTEIAGAACVPQRAKCWHREC